MVELALLEMNSSIRRFSVPMSRTRLAAVASVYGLRNGSRPTKLSTRRSKLLASRPALPSSDRNEPMSSSRFHVVPLTTNWENYHSIAGEGLLSPCPEQWRLYIERVGKENVRGVYRDHELLGGMAFYRMGQWFGGRQVPTAGFSGVAIQPAARGSGACRTMLVSVLQELYQDGTPLASLYASTQRLYRKLGFEQAGTLTQYNLPIASIGLVDRELPVARFEQPPLDQLIQVAEVRAKASNGNLQRTQGLWQRLLLPYDGAKTVTYLLGESSSPDGYCILKAGDRQAGIPQPLVAVDLAVNTPPAARRLMTLVNDHRSMCDSFQWVGPLDDSLIALAAEQRQTISNQLRWLNRIIRFGDAWEARGFPLRVETDLHFDVTDALLPENAGRWRIEISDGRARVTRGGEGSLRIGIGPCATLFTGFYSASQLRRLGWLETEDERQLAEADAALCGPSPWMPEVF